MPSCPDMVAARAAKGRRFVKAVFRVPAAMADEAAGLLIARGALGCAIAARRPDARPKKTASLEAFFPRLSASDLDALVRTMAAAAMLARGTRPRVERIVDPGWSTLWKRRFTPLPIGRRFLIVPSWSKARAPGRLRIVIQPGRAFGTGHHATTAGMLRALERLCAARRSRRGLDVGTGSGVLAIAMKLLGVERVVGIDIDPEALENARENAALNGLRGKLILAATPLARLRGRFDLIVANILASTLIAIAPQLKRALKPGGRLILGGILAREAQDVLAAFEPGLKCTAAVTARGWTTLVMAR